MSVFQYADTWGYADGKLVIAGNNGNWTDSAFATTSPVVKSHILNASKNADGACAAQNSVALLGLDLAKDFVMTFVAGAPTLPIAGQDGSTLYIGDPNGTVVGITVGWGIGERTAANQPSLAISDGTTTIGTSVVLGSPTTNHAFTLSYAALGTVTTLSCDGVTLASSNAWTYTNPTLTLYLDYDGAASIQITNTVNVMVNGTYHNIPSTAAASNNNVIVTWSAYPGADHYRISKDGGAYGSNVTSPWTDVGAGGTSHTYTIQAYDAGGNVLAASQAGFATIAGGVGIGLKMGI